MRRFIMSQELPTLDPLASFVDVGSEYMHVSVGGNKPEVFGTVTSQLHALRDWLLEQGVHSVAMEATGVYWLALYGVLESAGLEVRMVNGRQTRNLPGRKTDMADSQWGATLHMHGLLHAGFVPPADIRRLQDYLRLRASHVAAAAACVQLMQKGTGSTLRCADPAKKGTGRDRSPAWHLGRRAHLRAGPGIAILGPLPETHRRLRQAHRCGTATAR
jgi:transposase